MSRLAVWLYDKHVGTLRQDKSGRMSFSYVDATTPALSLSMPVREQPYEHHFCESFFGGLLPESDQARQLIGRRFGVNGNNSFSLLSVIGDECAGAISIFPDDRKPPLASQAVAHKLSERELADHIRALPRRPLLVGVEGIRLSLAGAGDKAAVCIVDGEVALPTGGCITTHILKPNISTIGDTVANEFFCMKLAARMGLMAAAVELRSAEDVEFLLIKRYDRHYDQAGNLARLHQEDICQALGVVSAHKYQSEGGPSYKDCFELLRRVARPAIDRNRMIDYVIFNYLIGNVDAHGKNFSILHEPSLVLAPLYDVLSTQIYPEVSNRLAMRVDKYYEPERIVPRHWKRLADECGLSYPALKRTFLEFCTRITVTAEGLRDELAKTGYRRTYSEISEQIDKNTALVSSRFSGDS